VRTGPPKPLVKLTGLLLAGYLAVAGWAWSSTTNDPQAGMAVGFLMLVTLFLLGLAGLLWLSVVRQRAWLAWVVFAFCAWPSLSLVARGIYLLLHGRNR